MRRSLFAVLALASLIPTIALADNNDDCVRVNQVRAFAAETDTSLIVRQGKGQFKRITVQAGCPIEDADRIGFAVGSQQLYTQAVDGRFIPTNSTNLQNRFCTASAVSPAFQPITGPKRSDRRATSLSCAQAPSARLSPAPRPVAGWLARICAASRPAFAAPALPMASVPTGIPRGI